MNAQFKYKNHVLLMALAALYPLTGQAAGAARVEFVTGSVTAVNAAGVQRELARGAELESGDAVRTGTNARAQLRFSDGGMMSIQPGTEFHIDNYKFDGKADGTERGFFSVVKGGLRAISGAIGHGSNQDNYRVSTPVATIGIRGTEYFLVYTGGDNGQLSVRTGEGAIILQNAGGAIIVPSGGAAVVTGGNTSKPQETNTFIISSGTSSAPATVTPAAAPVATTENRTSDGSLAILANSPLISGPNYSLVAAADSGPNSNPTNYSPVTATFGSNSVLTSFTDGSGTVYTADSVAFAASAGGVIGWGNWSSGTVACDCSALTNFAYVVGIPTSATDLSNLNGTTATYNVIGYTTPTSDAGATFSSGTFSASLTASFGASSSVSGTVGFTMANSGSYAVSGQFNNVSLNGATFQTSSALATVNGGSSSVSMAVSGLLAGANASHAGFVYQINTASPIGNVSGAVAFAKQ